MLEATPYPKLVIGISVGFQKTLMATTQAMFLHDNHHVSVVCKQGLQA